MLNDILLKSWTRVVSGNSLLDDIPSSNPEFVFTMRQIVDKELEGILDYLAQRQDVQLETLDSVDQDSSPDDQLKFIRVLTANIHKVQNNQHGAITPRISRDLNGLDCSMSTWVMQHEIKKVGLNFRWGAPIGHAVGILNLSSADIYYADGQNGFVEKIEVTENSIGNGAIVLTINNYKEIQERQPRFFPKYVLTGPNVDVGSTMTNIDSMIYKQYLGEITQEMEKKLGKDVEVIIQMQPYAIEFQEEMSHFSNDVNKTAINNLMDEMFPELKQFREMSLVKADEKRMNNRN